MVTVIIGAGAAGLMAAYAASVRGESVLVLEKNEKAGKKIYITGKGRCNVTNACDFDVFRKSIVNGEKFMMSSLRAFGPEELMDFLEKNHCRVKVERGNRVFPVSDHASDVTKALLLALGNAGVRIHYHTEVTAIEKDAEGFAVTAVEGTRKIRQHADKVIVCTGGLSYPTTGSTGDGYRFAEKFGLSVRKPVPSLTELVTREDTSSLAGVSLINTGVTVRKVREDNAPGKEVLHDVGELLFTHKGLSGPLILTASALITRALSEGEKFEISLDLKPGLSREELDKRLLRDLEAAKNQDMGNALSRLLISGIRELVLGRAEIPSEKKAHDLRKEERERLLKTIKNLTFEILRQGDFSGAVITQGGVDLKEINPKNMESKKVPGLFFAGEVLDVDAMTGGFNLQIAFSTGMASGK